MRKIYEDNKILIVYTESNSKLNQIYAFFDDEIHITNWSKVLNNISCFWEESKPLGICSKINFECLKFGIRKGIFNEELLQLKKKLVENELAPKDKVELEQQIFGLEDGIKYVQAKLKELKPKQELKDYSPFLLNIKPDDVVIAYGIKNFVVKNNEVGDCYVETYDYDIIKYDDIDEIQRVNNETGEYRTIWQSINSVKHRLEAKKRMTGEK